MIFEGMSGSLSSGMRLHICRRKVSAGDMLNCMN